MRIALAQLNTTVGDVAGNERRVLEAYRRAVEAGAELVVTPELSLTGYPPRDLLLRDSFIEANLAALERLAWVWPLDMSAKARTCLMLCGVRPLSAAVRVLWLVLAQATAIYRQGPLARPLAALLVLA